jgi:cell fate (sporulation/competence/biofilm development) regulator YlbF (YheA/YmcA/DUF963 family)
LKTRIADLEELMRGKETRANLQQDRAKKRIDDLLRRNQDLQDEIKQVQSSTQKIPKIVCHLRLQLVANWIETSQQSCRPVCRNCLHEIAFEQGRFPDG